MDSTYGELVTRLCQLRDQMKETYGGRKVLTQLCRELEVLRDAESEYGGLFRTMALELRESQDIHEGQKNSAGGGNESMNAMVLPAAEAPPAEAGESFCHGCKFEGKTSGIPFCDYAGITGRPRTIYQGRKVDFCPRKK